MICCESSLEIKSDGNFPNANVNDDGEANVDNSIVENDNVSCRAMREKVIEPLRAHALKPTAKHASGFC